MKIFVCIKQVPDTETKIKLAADSMSVDAGGIKWVVNPYDEFAIEEGIKIRDANPGSQLWALSVGPKKRTVEALRTALAMGADEAIAVDAPENLDVSSSAAAAAQVLKTHPETLLILTGKVAIDDNAGSFGQMLAESLGFPHATVVSHLKFSKDSVEALRDIEGGAKEKIQLKTPCLIAANKGLNTPRYASLPGIMKAKKKVIQELAAETGAASGIVLKSLSLPPDRQAVQMLTGEVPQMAQQLVNLLRDQAKVLS